jgi:hypothetical protein
MKAKHALIFSFILPVIAYAQTTQTALYNKGDAIYVQKNALLEVQGNFENTSGGIYNDGTIELTGDFENGTGAQFKVHSNTASKDRVVKFIGGGTQAIKGDFSDPSTASFYNLVIDKASPTSTVEMQTGIAVKGSLVFGTANLTTTYNPDSFYHNNNKKGLLKTYDSGSGEYLLDVQNGNPDAIAGYPVLQIDGAPNTGFILTKGLRGSSDGGLQRSVASATSYLFPIGTEAKGFNGSMLNFTQIPGNGSVKAKFCDGSSSPDGIVGTISPYCSGCPPEQYADNLGYNRFFENNPCNGGAPQWMIFDHTVSNHGYWSFESSNTGYQYDMEVFPNSIGDPTADRFSPWRVLKHEDVYGADPSLPSVDWMPEIEGLITGPTDLTAFTRNTGCYMGNGVPGGSYRNFSHFAMGLSHSSNALPVKLLFVKADPMGKHRIRVSWATSLEINNDGFKVMRSTDGVNFSDIGWVEGHDNSTEQHDYFFDDRVTDNITYYYRLRQIDNDGHFEYSQIVEAKLADGGGEAYDYSLYPNPTSNEVFITVQNPVDEITVKVYDLGGKLAYDNIFPVEQNGVSQTVSVGMAALLPTGAYVLNATTNGTKFSKQIILQ